MTFRCSKANFGLSNYHTTSRTIGSSKVLAMIAIKADNGKVVSDDA